MLRSFVKVMFSVQVMAVCRVGMVSALFVIAGLVMFGGLLVMCRCVAVMLGSFAVMFRALVRHDGLLWTERCTCDSERS